MGTLSKFGGRAKEFLGVYPGVILALILSVPLSFGYFNAPDAGDFHFFLSQLSKEMNQLKDLGEIQSQLGRLERLAQLSPTEREALQDRLRSMYSLPDRVRIQEMERQEQARNKQPPERPGDRFKKEVQQSLQRLKQNTIFQVDRLMSRLGRSSKVAPALKPWPVGTPGMRLERNSDSPADLKEAKEDSDLDLFKFGVKRDLDLDEMKVLVDGLIRLKRGDAELNARKLSFVFEVVKPGLTSAEDYLLLLKAKKEFNLPDAVLQGIEEDGPTRRELTHNLFQAYGTAHSSEKLEIDAALRRLRLFELKSLKCEAKQKRAFVVNGLKPLIDGLSRLGKPRGPFQLHLGLQR